MKKLAFFTLAALLTLAACKTKTTPNRLKKNLDDGPWKVAKFIDGAINITTSYEGYVFDFQEESNLFFLSPALDTLPSSWEVPDNTKNPALLILRTPTADSISAPLSDDWNVIFLTKDEFRLERLNGKFDTTDVCYFRRIGS